MGSAGSTWSDGFDRFFSQQHFKLTLTGERVGGVHTIMMDDDDGDDDDAKIMRR